MKFNKLTAFVILAALTLGACAKSAPVNLNGEWKLVSYGDAKNPTLALPDVNAFITFEDGKLNGNVGCNGLGADYSLDGNTLTTSMGFATKMYCQDTMAQEDAVLQIISEATLKVSFDGNKLTLTSADGALVIVLEKK
ncbi:MAG: META domain-containing protein [Anaerolineales bacterium]|nr:META domain-containing protein [Anaerolineales bacterium]